MRDGNELEICLRPNVGWQVKLYRNGRCEGPVTDRWLLSRPDAIQAAERAAAKLKRRGVDVTIDRYKVVRI